MFSCEICQKKPVFLIIINWKVLKTNVVIFIAYRIVLDQVLMIDPGIPKTDLDLHCLSEIFSTPTIVLNFQPRELLLSTYFINIR